MNPDQHDQPTADFDIHDIVLAYLQAADEGHPLDQNALLAMHPHLATPLAQGFQGCVLQNSILLSSGS